MYSMYVCTCMYHNVFEWGVCADGMCGGQASEDLK
jgi:hypothetical protein